MTPSFRSRPTWSCRWRKDRELKPRGRDGWKCKWGLEKSKTIVMHLLTIVISYGNCNRRLVVVFMPPHCAAPQLPHNSACVSRSLKSPTRRSLFSPIVLQKDPVLRFVQENLFCGPLSVVDWTGMDTHFVGMSQVVTHWRKVSRNLPTFFDSRIMLRFQCRVPKVDWEQT